MGNDVKQLIQSIFQNIWSSLVDENDFSRKIIITLIIFIFGIWLFKIIHTYIDKSINNIRSKNIIQKSFKKIYSLIILILLMNIWINAKNSFVFILLIIISLFIFSIKNLSTNIVAWFMLINKKFFKLYDRIEVNGIKGDVIKITPFYFKLMERGKNLSSSTATGRIIYMPNHVLLNYYVYNFNIFTPINWEEVEYCITIDSGWEEALVIVENHLYNYINSFHQNYSKKEIEDIQRKIDIFDGNLNFKTYLLLEKDYIKIVGQYPVNYQNGSNIKSYLNKLILPDLKKSEQIELVGKQIHIKYQ